MVSLNKPLALVTHSDLKLDNILITESNEVRIADFGLSVDLTNSRRITWNGKICRDYYVKTLCGTPAYVAPEVFHSKHDGYHAVEADLWSL